MQHGAKLPAEDIGVLHAGAQALTTGRRMNMCSVASKEHAAGTIFVSKTRDHVVSRCPRHGMKYNVRTPGPLLLQRRQASGTQIDIALQWNGRLQLKQVGARQGTQRDLRLHVAIVESKPGIPAESGQDSIGDNRANTERLARESDSERLAHKAASSVSSHQLAHRHLFLTQGGCHSGLVLLEAGEPATEFNFVAELSQALAQHGLREKMRDQERRPVGLRRCRPGHLENLRVLKTAIRPIGPQGWIRATDGHQTIDHAQILEYFQGAGLDALAA